MEPLNFCYWLQGCFELSDPNSLTKEQVEEIKNHLALVFEKKTPVIDIPEKDPEDLWEPRATEPLWSKRPELLRTTCNGGVVETIKPVINEYYGVSKDIPPASC